MADRCCTYTWGTIVINGDVDTDTAVITDAESDGILGLDGAPIRRQIDPVALDDGGDSQDALLAHRIITVTAHVHIGTHPNRDPTIDTPGYNTKLVTLQKAWVAECEAHLNTAQSLTWTDATGASRSINAKYGVEGGEIVFGGTTFEPTVTFQLLAEDPTIS